MATRRDCIGFDLVRLADSSKAEALCAYAKKRGWKLARLFEESSESRATVFRRMLRACKNGDTVLIYSFARLPNYFRSLLQLINALEMGKLHAVIFIREEMVFSLNRPESRRYIQMLKALASAQTEIRVSKSRLAKKIAALIGARRSKRTSKITPEVENEIMRLFEQNVPIREIARRFASAPVRISRGSIQGVIRQRRKALTGKID